MPAPGPFFIAHRIDFWYPIVLSWNTLVDNDSNTEGVVKTSVVIPIVLLI